MHEYLVQLPGGAGQGRYVAEVPHDLDPLQLRLEQHQRALYALVQVDFLEFGLVQAGEIAQAAGDGVYTPGAGGDDPVGLVDHPEDLLQPVAVAGLVHLPPHFGDPPLEGVVHAADRPERRVDLVRHTGGEQTDRSEPVRLAQLRLELGLVGDVVDDHDGRPAAASPNR